MRRTPPWVFVAAVAVQLAALGLCIWAMELGLRADEQSPDAALPAPEPPATPPPNPEPAPEPRLTAPPQAPSEPEPERKPEPERRPEPESRPEPEPVAEQFREPERPREFPRHEPPPGPAVVRAAREPRRDPAFEESEHVKPPPAVVRVQHPSPQAPLFGPPPSHARVAQGTRDTVPRFITELADATTQIVRGVDAGFAFGFYPDGNIRFVDDDGGLYAGKADSARARMREIDGMRAFTVQIGVAADGRLQASFTGGTHDSRTIALEPMVGWSAA
jgi:hypothetical protein